MKFTQAALECIEETGADPEEDLDHLRSGDHTLETLLAFCLDGAGEDRVQGWREYIDTLALELGEWQPRKRGGQ